MSDHEYEAATGTDRTRSGAITDGGADTDADGDGRADQTIRNEELAARLAEFAARLEATGVEYKPRAYRQAAESVRTHPESVATLAHEGTDALEAIDRVGEAIAAKLVEYVETGTIDELEALREELPADIDALTAVEGVGPKTVGRLYEALGIVDLDDLERAAREGHIREIDGFGATTEANILEGIPFARRSHERRLLSEARPLAEDALAHLRTDAAVVRAAPAGSLRRWRPTVGDVDILVATESGGPVIETFTDWPAVDRVIEAGTTKASVRAEGVRVDLRTVAPEEFGAALQYFTGSKDHNVHLRNVAIDRGLKINEYGVFDVSELEDPDVGQRVGERLGGETETSIYEAVGMRTPPPELREDRGEIEGAIDGTLPELVTVEDVRGDLHSHTEWSDGDTDIETMLAGAAARGYDYLAVTDHATGGGIGDWGLDDTELAGQIDAVREAAATVDADLRVFAGVEANITPDGELTVADALLDRLDLVVASPHTALSGDGTDRLIAAAEHPAVDIVGHPTGRRLGQRAGLDVDVPALAAAAADAGTALEINAGLDRLDLRGGAVQAALEAGATVVVNTDAHRPGDFERLRYGVHTARRGWAEAGDVLTTWPVEAVEAFIE